MDEDELAQLRQEQDDTVADLAHAYPAIAELVEASVDIAPMADGDGEHELACRLIADEIFERHRDHLDALGALRVLDLVDRVVSKMTGSGPAGAASASLREQTLPELRAEVDDEPTDRDELAERERQLRDAAALVLAASNLRKTALDR